ncbi:hypothetical protein REPUB_Repub12eG0175500 [Reevesia pubescens]
MATKENGDFLLSFNERKRDMGIEAAIRKCDELYQQQKIAFYGSIAAMLLLILIFVLVVLLTRKPAGL